MNILGIETSCDDTSSAVVKDGRYIITNIISSQIKIHKKYGGIVPELASRHHLENINLIIDEALRITKRIDAVSVTTGPGLIGSLLIGTTTAQAISKILNIPIVGINHIEGHIFANFLEKKKDKDNFNPPFISLIVSGGHTDLILVKNIGNYKIIGRTRDDAVGEVLDKIAKFLNLGYPGGPIIDRLSRNGNPKEINFPRAYLHDTWDFSFSGLKTAVINFLNHNSVYCEKKLPDLLASFQQSCIDVLIRKTILACNKFKIKKIALGGGVSANTKLRMDFSKICRIENIKLLIPKTILCTDNAAMIASAGYFKLKKCKRNEKIVPSANMELKSWGGL
ncbi:MAG: tRNA (adenosine(37)-N6)-threonylcarbamoyltransferase complex transferase subunit TsaD [Elusimicrobia bacterium RIFOXYC2_FULL_34_12]|nr:MAG: tRNA (adenosine(37)-N6)-threonylcarbamoyltransferase complex transferase subunit TsaD [Elusimicrobia bacterium RIFOXYC2_FULL_34_12]